ncbi:MAG: inorganic diphosphatase [Candidatus Aenigmatarchaeota archaeon]|nr:inorganic diphosphatase [Candidatus Aenigmarchaeota archaeon]
MNLWKDTSIGANPPEEVNLIIEIPKGFRNKIEFDKETGIFKLDRVLHKPFRFKWNYGFIPQTLYEDGDAADGLVIMEESLPPGTVVSVRPIGLMKFVDTGESDDKLITVAVKDPDYKKVLDIKDLNKKTLNEIKYFFNNYKKAEGKKTEVKGLESSVVAKDFIMKSIELYKKKFG